MARAQRRKRECLLDATIQIGRSRRLIVGQSCGHGARHFGFRAAAERGRHDGYFAQWNGRFYPQRDASSGAHGGRLLGDLGSPFNAAWSFWFHGLQAIAAIMPCTI
jgi:hypothetical protein